MARPTKIGLTYFSMDVDIFEDEKVIPVSSEFGPKGECIIVRVLCAIYRNGYFAECSDAFKFKIAKQANLPSSLVSEVIVGLVKWGFFDKAVFDSFNVITSTGIQKRWKEATRKRVSKNELDYWILELSEQKQGFPAEETPLSRSESTQSKVKESKVNKTKDEEPIRQRFLLEISEIENYLKSEQQWKEVICMQNQFSMEHADKLISEFTKALIGRAADPKTPKDAKEHFYNWVNKQSNGRQEVPEQTTRRRKAADILQQ